MSLVVIKIYSPLSKHPQIVKVTSFPCSIGRAVKNDIILHDEAVSSVHAVIEKGEAGYFIRDQGSLNGIFVGGEKKQLVPLGNNLELYIGHCRLHFILEEWDAEETKEINYQQLLEADRKLLMLRSLARYIGQVTLIFVLCGIGFYLDYGVESRAIRFAGTFLGYLFFSLFSASVIASFSKLQNKVYQFGPIITIIQWLLIVVLLLQNFGGTIDFNIGDNWFRELFSFVFYFFLGLWFFSSLGKILFPAVSLTRMKIWVGGFLLSLTILTRVFHYFEQENNLNHDLSTTIGYPLIPVASDPGNFEDLFQKLDRSAERIESLRQKMLEKQEKKRKN